MRLIIAASTAGTIFEWYDFFIYGTLSAIIGKTFFPAGNATLQTLLVWATFAVGFGFRPFGAVLFGFFGDRLGRKYTFLVTVTLMGLATAAVGMIPSTASIGMAAPLIIIALRVMQGLALGGEYGGAAIYVAEHAPAERRGTYTGWIQTSAMGGFILSIAVVLTCKAVMAPATWADWGWRVPFLLSVLLLAISLWMRLKLSESPVFRAMKEEGSVSGNPFIESLTYPGNLKRLLVAMVGSAAGMTVIYYTALFYMLTFLKGPLRVDDTVAEATVGIAALLATLAFQPIGAWSDKVGRKLPLVLGYVAALALLFPAFHAIGQAANPRLTEASAHTPVVVAGPDCHFDTFASDQASQCGKLLADLANLGVPYRLANAPVTGLSAGGQPVALDGYPWGDKAARAKAMPRLLAPHGYDLNKVTPPWSARITIGAWIFALSIALGLTYGGMAAQLAEMFPARIRYSSMSIPYHLGTGYFGGFLPLIASYMVAKSGNPYQGLWYTLAVVAAALLVTLWGAEGGPPRDFSEDG
ncbi:MAG: MFS transporter [Proteobacteria bacterium]|nr:MFS transporter [Pseudomonadota bacterium]